MNSVWDLYQDFLERGAKNDAAMLTLAVVLMEHVRATRAIAHGDVNGATGLEGLAMAIAGTGLKHPLSGAIDDVGSALVTIASAIDQS